LRHPSHDDPNRPSTSGYHDGAGDSHHYNPNQPRVPAGHPDGGQWTGGESGQPKKVQLAFFRRAATEAAAKALQAAAAQAATKTIEAGLAFFSALSAYNSRHQRAVIEVQVKARQFQRDDYPGSQFNFRKPQFLTRQQVGNVCDRLGEVQDLVDNAVKNVTSRRNAMTPTQYGTAVHKWVKDNIGTDPDLVAEQSFVKLVEEMKQEGLIYRAEETRYGKDDSIRIDVLQRKDRKTVCVYDIKTGKTGLSLARFLDIVDHVHGTYPEATDIIITEVRPSDPWRPANRPRLQNH
jgi:hypothetical protein